MQFAETELQSTIELRAPASEIAAPKPDLDTKARTNDFETLVKRFFIRKITSAKIGKILLTKSLSQPWCGHSNTTYDVQLQKIMVLRTHLRRQATSTQPLQSNLQRLSCKAQWSYAQQRQKLQLQNLMDLDAKAKKKWSTCEKEILKENH